MSVTEFLLDPFLISLLICVGFLYIITWEYSNDGTDCNRTATDSPGGRMHQVRASLFHDLRQIVGKLKYPTLGHQTSIYQ